MKDSIITDAVTLYAVLDPIATVPLFLSATRDQSPASRRRIAARATVIAAAILIIFIVLGQIFLKALGISLPSFQIAGGLVLLAVGMKMIFSEVPSAEKNSESKGAQSSGDIAVFPIAMPFIAGPAAIMAVVMLTDNDRFSIPQQAETTAVLLVILLIVYLALVAADRIQRVLGETGINVMSRVMGLILAALAVEAILGGLRQAFPHT